MSTIPASAQAPDDFLFTEPEGRPFRAISIETEVDGPGPKLATDLFKCGIIGTPYVMEYGSHPGVSHPHVAFLKHDGSVTAGEVVFDRIYLSNPLHAKAFRIATERMRQLEKKGVIAFNPNCGGHIWMDAKGFGFYDLLRLMVLFGHLEEPIFRLAGAGKTYGHRSLFKGYDRAHNGRGYSNPVVKGPFTDPVLAMNSFRTQHRMSGLNISKYVSEGCKGCSPVLAIRPEDGLPDAKVEKKLQLWLSSYTAQNGERPSEQHIQEEREYFAASLGRAGGRDLKNCTCDHRQFAVEWRVWNAQSNPRILYAWIAFMQAAHAYCWRPVDSSDYREHVDMLALGWERRPFDGADLGYQKKAQDRVEFIFNELPLADVEKDALAYTFMRSPYKVWGKPFFTKLAQTPYKPPEYSNVYKGIPVRKIQDVAELVEEAKKAQDARVDLFDGPLGSPRLRRRTTEEVSITPPSFVLEDEELTEARARMVRSTPGAATTWTVEMPSMETPVSRSEWQDSLRRYNLTSTHLERLDPEPAPDVGMEGE